MIPSEVQEIGVPETTDRPSESVFKTILAKILQNKKKMTYKALKPGRIALWFHNLVKILNPKK
jgi:hypothetical protein